MSVKISKRFFLLSGCLFLTACVSTSSFNQSILNKNQTIISSGSYEVKNTGVTYQNTALGLVVSMPSGWKPLNRAQINELSQDDTLAALQKSNGNKLVADYLDKQMKENVIRLFYAFQDNAGEVPKANFVITLLRKGVFDPADANGLKNLIVYKFSNSKPEKNVSFNTNFPLVNIAGKSFVHYEIIRSGQKVKYYEEYYLHPEGEFNLSFLFVFVNAPDKAQEKNIFSTVQLNSSGVMQGN